jgi:hypothetical protein
VLREDQLFHVAHAYEQATDWHKRQPSFTNWYNCWWLSFTGSHQVKIGNTENVSSLLLIGEKLPKKLLLRHPILSRAAAAKIWLL